MFVYYENASLPSYFRIFLVLTAAALLFVGVIQHRFFDKWEFIKSDGFGYYIYLPSLLIHGSLEHSEALAAYLDVPVDELAEQPRLQAGAAHAGVPELNGVYLLPNGNYMSKYPFGVAVLQLPFFLAADLLGVLSGGERTGFETIYQFAALFSAVFYYAVGAFFIYKLLAKRFRPRIVQLCLAVMFLGTGLIHYTTYDASFSHVYSLALIAALCFVVDRSQFAKDRRLILISALLVGLITLVRNTNIVIAVIPIGLILLESKPAGTVAKLFKKLVLFSAVVIVLILMLSLYWWAVAGSFVINSYQGEGFNFLAPQFGNVLFNVSSGLLFWHPLLLLGILGLVIGLKRRDRLISLGIPVLLLTYYVIASWWAWWYGASFGHRGFVDYYIFFYLGLGYFLTFSVERLSGLKPWIARVAKVSGILVIVFLLFLNLLQMNNYWRGNLAHDITDWERYKQVFLRPCLDVELEFLRCERPRR